MSLSTSIASSRGGGPRKHTGSISNPKHHHHHQHSSGSRKHQSTNSEEEIAQRQQRNRTNATKSTCCVISLVSSTSLPVWATSLMVTAAVVCLSFLQEMATT